jgi:hypothetical protein
MIEAYAFLAAFTVQILVLSVLHPGWLARYARAKAEVQFLGWDSKSIERFFSLYRVVNMGIAVLGLVLLGWLFNDTRSPDWDIRPVTRLLSRYTVLQALPFVLVSLMGSWGKRKALTRAPPQVKRTASLQRRGLFDIVSPFTVFLAVLAYVLLAAFVIFIRQRPFPPAIVSACAATASPSNCARFFGYGPLGIVTLVLALNAFTVYWTLYRRKRWPLETRAYRMQAVEMQVKMLFYVSIAVIVFLSLIVTLALLDMQRWVPFAVSVYVVVIMLISSTQLFAMRRQAEADQLGPSPAS